MSQNKVYPLEIDYNVLRGFYALAYETLNGLKFEKGLKYKQAFTTYTVAKQIGFKYRDNDLNDFFIVKGDK